MQAGQRLMSRIIFQLSCIFNFEVQFLTKPRAPQLAKWPGQLAHDSSGLCIPALGLQGCATTVGIFTCYPSRAGAITIAHTPEDNDYLTNSSVSTSSAAERWTMSPSMSHYWLSTAPVLCRPATGNCSCFVISCLCCQCHSQMAAIPRLLPDLLALTFFLQDLWILGRQINILFRTRRPTVVCINTLSSHVSLHSPLHSDHRTAKVGAWMCGEGTWILS